MRFCLRTLTILLAVSPPVLAGCYFTALTVLRKDDLDAYRHPRSAIFIELYQPVP
jgi:hypothetical protein